MQQERIPFDTMKNRFAGILTQNGFSEEKAEQVARIFSENSRDGVYSHGLNRFPTFVSMLQEGLVDCNAVPEQESNNGLVEQWNGNLGPGMLNAKFCMDRAIDLAKKDGISCVSLRNTNHWMRGGTYGWQAADAGCIGICFTNTIANVPPWGGIDPRLGNNPFIIAVPRKEGHVVLDMAVSQYSYGKLMQYESEGRELPIAGGYDHAGNLTTNAAEIISTRRILPIGFWKGSGLSLMLDILVTILSKGQSTSAITAKGKESGLSQVFICIRQDDPDLSEKLIGQILDFAKSSRSVTAGQRISYPGENTLRTRVENLKEGIPVDEAVWKKVLAM
ncbi:MAG: 3-dehydro-L-gulonate 2-dehydrogenase [Bacteroidota bacterium]